MKCPICGNTLVPSKKDPDVLLCHHCKKKFRPKKKPGKNTKTPEPKKAAAKKAPDPGFDGTNRIPEPAKSEPAEEELADRTRVFSREEVQAALRETEAERKRKKKAAAAKQTVSRETSDAGSDDDDVEFHFRYANIPPKEVREKQEREMRKAYDELLSIGEEERESKHKRRGLFHRRKK